MVGRIFCVLELLGDLSDLLLPLVHGLTLLVPLGLGCPELPRQALSLSRCGCELHPGVGIGIFCRADVNC
ncbi:hypothetical protein AB852_02170 [Streptomyces uncialis]|uniref:Uncharacterized protein n=1 Tax=Streptomyces uncialis TaxID=1048205 RepID=A0A1Q4VCR6_9ACTN|nr:hypothetical protein AB852_02170 [Streptomyces uncialis]